jgi:hypothetical protein
MLSSLGAAFRIRQARIYQAITTCLLLFERAPHLSHRTPSAALCGQRLIDSHLIDDLT